ncbi:MAG: alkaline phosphatase D family protein [Planctomycetota bacterium]|jgi:alkaline phosphatase D
MSARTTGCRDVVPSFLGPAVVVLIAASLLAPLSAQDRPVPPQVTGPMVGHVTDRTACLWAHVEPARSIDVSWWPAHDPTLVRQAEMVADPAKHAAATITLPDLEPDTAYGYALALDEVRDPRWTGSFTTAPAPGSPTRFTMAVSSCMQIGDNQSAWYLLLKEQPALQLLLGDNHYADTTEYETIWSHHLAYRRVPEFAAVLRQVPTYAMWDDHDYGPNNSDGTAPGKEHSLRAFTETWCNPGAGTDQTPGAFFSFRRGDVEFFILDGRYHRSPDEAPNDIDKRMLGDAQFAWLEAGLVASTAPFKVLASGSTLRASESDGWRLYDFARERLFRLIMDNRIGGVIYLSGDMHWSAIAEHGPHRTGGYPIYEVISSGITRGNDRSFATLTFDTTLRDPTVRVRIIHGDDTVRTDRTIRASELQVPEGPGS